MSVNRKRHSQRAIKQAFCELLLEKPIEKVFVKAICARADYSTMAFYASYQDKYDLARQIIKDEVNQHITDNEKAIKQLKTPSLNQNNIKHLFQTTAEFFFERVASHPLTYRCLFENRLVDDGIDYFAGLNSQSLQKQVHVVNQEDRGDQTYQQFFIEQTSVMLLNAAKYWQEHGYSISAHQLAQLYSRFRIGWLDQVNISGNAADIRIVFG